MFAVYGKDGLYRRICLKINTTITFVIVSFFLFIVFVACLTPVCQEYLKLLMMFC